MGFDDEGPEDVAFDVDSWSSGSGDKFFCDGRFSGAGGTREEDDSSYMGSRLGRALSSAT